MQVNLREFFILIFDPNRMILRIPYRRRIWQLLVLPVGRYVGRNMAR